MDGMESHQRIEVLYHRLCVDEPVEAAMALEQLDWEWELAGRPEPLQALAVVLEELLGCGLLQGVARARVLVAVGWIKAALWPGLARKRAPRPETLRFSQGGNSILLDQESFLFQGEGRVGVKRVH